MTATIEPTAPVTERHPDVCPECGGTGVTWPDSEGRICEMCSGSGWRPGHAPGDLNPHAYAPPTPDTVIDRVYLHNGVIRVDTHTVVNGQRIGKVYYADGGKLCPMPIETARCEGCGSSDPSVHDTRCPVHRAQPIGPGDFIASTLGGFWCGIVTRPVAVAFGRKGSIPGFEVVLGNGQRDWIAADHVVLIAKA